MGRGGSSSGKCWACDKAVPGLGGHGKKKGSNATVSLSRVRVCVCATNRNFHQLYTKQFKTKEGFAAVLVTTCASVTIVRSWHYLNDPAVCGQALLFTLFYASK